MTSTIDHDRSHLVSDAEAFPLHELAARAGIVPEYFDLQGNIQRASDDTRRALLAAMGIDASSDATARASLERLRDEERAELVAPVRVVRLSSISDGASASIDVRVPSGELNAMFWRLEVDTEAGDRLVTAGECDRPAMLALPSPIVPAGYHRIRVTVASAAREWTGDQTLIVTPDRCCAPDDLLGDAHVFGLIANLYTIRSSANWGVGDLSDLAALAEWGGSVGADFVGVNPLHALLNRGNDISPYSPVSRLFRNPIYIDVMRVPELRDATALADRMTSPEFSSELDALRDAPAVRYEQVMGVKGLALDALHRVFEERVRGSGDDRDRAYEAYVAANDPALSRFATWMAIGELPGHGFDWRTWPSEFRNPDGAAVARFAEERAHRLDFHRWLQFELDRQLEEAAADARAAGMRVGLYSDLAIGTSPAGADTWACPELFVRGASIGAPPDPYAATGQNWGLPPIDPRALRRDRYQYFINLLRSAFRHAGALRIDHVLGLFRLFWIPDGRSGANGAYVRYPADDLLGIIALESVRHRALVVGEDLGTVPPEVPPTLARWGVLSSKVLLFECDHDGEYRRASSYPALSLATANTHDMAALSGFWSGRDIDVRRHVGLFANDDEAQVAHNHRDRERAALIRLLANDHVLPDAHAPASLAELRGAVHAFLCQTPARLAGISLDDLSGEVEPVNVPGVGPDKYPSWTRKMRDTLETITTSDDTYVALRCDTRVRRDDLEAPSDA
jgi:4-alpha-glucanotransferase